MVVFHVIWPRKILTLMWMFCVCAHSFAPFRKVFRPVTAVVGWRRWGPRCSVVRVHFLLWIEHWMEKQQKRMKQRVLSCTDYKNRKQLPTNTGGNRLPKYGSQSETTIDSCLYLGTIPGQTHRNTTHRTKHRNEKHRMPPQLTPWPNQNRDVTVW